MKKSGFAFPLLMFVTIAFAQKSKRLIVGDDAPEFKVAYWLKGNPGKGIENGKVSIVEFWATWCAPCIGNFPHLSKIADEYKSKGVHVFGISVDERKGVGFDSLRRFVAGPKGQSMHYTVGADDSLKYMSLHWKNATGQRGIPFAMIIDENGKIAWMGHPAIIDKPLAQIVSGSWDLKKARVKFIEDKRLDSIDNSIISKFNGYVSPEKCAAGLRAIDSLLKMEPSLKYREYTAHYTFVYLLNTDPERAVRFAREVWAANDIPAWFRVSDMVSYTIYKNLKMPASVYLLGADALQAQIDHYPWSMDNPKTYDELADFYFHANNKEKAIDSEKKAIASAIGRAGSTEKQIAEFKEKLKKYEGM